MIKPYQITGASNPQDIKKIDDLFVQLFDQSNQPIYYDRGDPAGGNDYHTNDFTTDGNWHSLDVSAIVPTGARAVLFLCYYNVVASASTVIFRKTGNVNSYNASILAMVAANTYSWNGDVVVACSSDRKIDYQTSNATFASLNIAIRGWWK